jgi:iron complex transport system ATP-binding protein
MTFVADRIEVRYGARLAVRAASFTLAAGELVALVGPNGAGKSSLLRALAGLLTHGGTVTWRDRALASLDRRERARTIAYLPQNPPVHWPLLARELIDLARLPHRVYGARASASDAEAVTAAMRQTDTLELAARSVEHLSAGERARVLLARALAVRAPVLLVDEPIAMLDPYHQLHVMNVLRAYAAGTEDNGPRLVVAVLHDLGLAARFCSRALLMNDGAIAHDGPPETALGAAPIRDHYRVEPLISRHGGEPVIVPWQRLDSDEPGPDRRR